MDINDASSRLIASFMVLRACSPVPPVMTGVLSLSGGFSVRSIEIGSISVCTFIFIPLCLR
ncbi:hypothetical protein [Cohnella rhizosphaerae]|uniref:Uncharacterized protein n=1 Tax=Cohnella rhizosphaerae TaxID=1457232 RepID=A0A9X4QSV5_9BACL|nr:hypothetical protein [Cohnella rhizosphaerae]MDG0809713.1 hypothetical protein [Cohnella rhizosphaerae]